MSQTDDDRESIEAALAKAVQDAGASVHAYPRRGSARRRIVLREHRDEQGSESEEAVLELDGTLRVTGIDQGPRVSKYFGSSITSYDWVYVVSSERVPLLIQALGGSPADDALDLLAKYYRRNGGAQMGLLLRGHPVLADFDNWHSS